MTQHPDTNKRTESVFFYLTPEDKKKFDASKDNYDLQLSIINQYFESEKNWIKSEMQQIDDNLLQYRALMLKTREAVKEAHKEHYDKINDFWDDISKSIPSFRQKVENINKELKPIVSELQQIKTLINDTSTYSLERIMLLVDKFSSMTEKDKEFFMVLFEHSKK